MQRQWSTTSSPTSTWENYYLKLSWMSSVGTGIVCMFRVKCQHVVQKRCQSVPSTTELLSCLTKCLLYCTWSVLEFCCRVVASSVAVFPKTLLVFGSISVSRLNCLLFWFTSITRRLVSFFRANVSRLSQSDLGGRIHTTRFIHRYKNFIECLSWVEHPSNDARHRA